MGVSAHVALLQNEKTDKLRPMIVPLQSFEHPLLRLRHRTPDAMTGALELANIDTGAG